VGVGVFSAYKDSSATLLSGGGSAQEQADGEFLGYMCLCSYILCDAFTSQYQSKLYVPLSPLRLCFASALHRPLSTSSNHCTPSWQ